MKLIDLQIKNYGKLLNDGDFNSLGYITHVPQKNKILSFAGNLDFYCKALENKAISCLLITEDLSKEIVLNVPKSLGILVCKNPMNTFFELNKYLVENTNFYGQSNKSVISPSANIHRTASISETNVTIGLNCIIEAGVVIHSNVNIGNNSIIRANTVIGSEGFEFKKINNQIESIPHSGGVLIGERVEIQSLCAVDRGIFGANTIIGDDTKIDNMVHIAHGVVIGKRCMLPACTMIAGAVQIGDDVWIDPASSISHEVKIGSRAKITIGSVVTKDVISDQKVAGNFAIDYQKFINFIKSIR